MSRRRDELRAFLSNSAPEAAGTGSPAKPETSTPRAPGERTPSGAVKAMGLQLGALRGGADEARSLRETMARGDHVVELDPNLIEPAFVADRLSLAGRDDESFESLKASIEAGGQEVPVLVRPHPDPARAAEGRFQAAYGHRRIAATRELGRKVRAVVRALTDEQLVLAQGKENAERRDLSFVERAFFCKALLERGFDRRLVGEALGVHKAEVSRLLQVAEAVPIHLAMAIGPAPRAGRPRWMALAELLKREANQVKAQEEIGLERFRSVASDARFQLMFDRLSRPNARRSVAEPVSTEEGARIATLRRSAKATTIEITERDFADFVATELPALHAAFAAANERPGEGD